MTSRRTAFWVGAGRGEEGGGAFHRSLVGAEWGLMRARAQSQPRPVLPPSGHDPAPRPPSLRPDIGPLRRGGCSCGAPGERGVPLGERLAERLGPRQAARGLWFPNTIGRILLATRIDSDHQVGWRSVIRGPAHPEKMGIWGCTGVRGGRVYTQRQGIDNLRHHWMIGGRSLPLMRLQPS